MLLGDFGRIVGVGDALVVVMPWTLGCVLESDSWLHEESKVAEKISTQRGLLDIGKNKKANGMAGGGLNQG